MKGGKVPGWKSPRVERSRVERSRVERSPGGIVFDSYSFFSTLPGLRKQAFVSKLFARLRCDCVHCFGSVFRCWRAPVSTQHLVNKHWFTKQQTTSSHHVLSQGNRQVSSRPLQLHVKWRDDGAVGWFCIFQCGTFFDFTQLSRYPAVSVVLQEAIL